MNNLSYNRTKHGNLTLSDSSIDESVLTRPHYKLADFTTDKGQAYAININNNFAYRIVGKRFDAEMQAKYPTFSKERCYVNQPLTLSELKK